MALRLRRRSRSPDAGGALEGIARLDRRTKHLVSRLRPGDVAIIDHDELDGVAAESLVERGVAAVVNARRSVSDRYPNLGPLVLARAGIPILDDVGTDVFAAVEEGDRVRLEGSTLWCRGVPVCKGVRLAEDEIRARLEAARARLSRTVEEFAANTLDYVRREQDILLDAVRGPELATPLRGRHVLVVARGYHYREDLDALATYIGEMRPAILAVDGAADALLDRGLRPDLILGDMDSVSAEALACGAELVVHAYLDGEAPGLRTVESLGLEAKVVTARGTSEDVALLLAYEQGAELIVGVGLHNSLVEFLDKGRHGMASTFLARLRIGTRLVDAKGVSQLYRRATVPGRYLVALVSAALLTWVIASIIFEPLRLYWSGVWETLRQLWFQLSNAF